MKKQIFIKYIPLFVYIIALIFFFRKEFIIAGSIIIIAGITGIILKRFGAELVILVGLLMISFPFQSISTPIISIILTLVGIYDLVQMYYVNQEIKKSNKKLTNEEKLSAYREKELLHNLLKKVFKIP